MKHKKIITLTIILFFITTQILGIITLQQLKTTIQGKNTNNNTNLNLKITDYNIIIAIIIGILLGYLLMKIIIKTKKKNIWIILYYYVTYTLLYTTLSTIIKTKNKISIILLTLTLILIKNYKKTNQIIKNIIEIFFYPAFAILFSPLLNPITAITLLTLISIYDAYTVWKSKSMIELAEFQLNTKFTGILIEYKEQYENNKNKSEKTLSKNNKTNKNNQNKKNIEKNIQKQQKNRKEKKLRKAILGGGDLAFTTIYTGTIYLHLGITLSLLTILFSTIGLTYLFLKSEKGKMYPAMPYITIFTIIPTITYYLINYI